MQNVLWESCSAHVVSATNFVNERVTFTRIKSICFSVPMDLAYEKLVLVYHHGAGWECLIKSAVVLWSIPNIAEICVIFVVIVVAVVADAKCIRCYTNFNATCTIADIVK